MQLSMLNRLGTVPEAVQAYGRLYEMHQLKTLVFPKVWARGSESGQFWYLAHDVPQQSEQVPSRATEVWSPPMVQLEAQSYRAQLKGWEIPASGISLPGAVFKNH